METSFVGPFPPRKLLRALESTTTRAFYGMGMRRMFPFTAAQWQELQRQALIYKHFISSVPVPCDLLLPSAAKSFPEAPTIFLPLSTMVAGRDGGGGGGGGGISLKFMSGVDPEPGRCRRTDGKKWRCARDSAPEQKYCERHLHRGRPRSRKPVEQRIKTSARCGKPSPVVASAQIASAAPTVLGASIELNLPFPSMESNEEPRSQDWMKSYTENLASSRQWEMMQSKMGSKYDMNQGMQHHEELPNLNYTDTNNAWCSFLNPSLSPLEETSAVDYVEPPRRLNDDSSVSLSLSMSNSIEEETDQIPMRLGGPLAEVLQSSNITSPHNSHDASPLDSPSGVLPKATLVSFSDGSSSCSSPRFAAPSGADFTFQWMNLNK